MAKESQYYIDKIPVSALQEGVIFHEKTSGVCKTPEGYSLKTDDFLKKLENDYQLPDLSEIMRESYSQLSHGYSVKSTINILSRFAPQFDAQKHQTINNDLGLNLVAARELLGDELAKEGINEKQVFERVKEGSALTPSIQFPISQIQEYAWYLTLINHRLIFKIARSNPRWSKWTDQEKEDYFQSSLIASWKVACRWDPGRAPFAVYLNVSLLGEAMASYFRYHEQSRSQDYNYLLPYRTALRLLSETKYASNHSMIILLSSLLYDQRNGRVDFSPENLLEALEEYARGIDTSTYGKTESETSNIHLEWKQPFHNFRRTITKRLRRIKAVSDIYNPFSLEVEGNRMVMDPNTGEYKSLSVQLLNRISAPGNIDDGLIQNELKKNIKQVLGVLTNRERFVIEMRHGLNSQPARTLDEISKILNITRERVRQIEAKALKKIRHPIRARNLRDYL